MTQFNDANGSLDLNELSNEEYEISVQQIW